MGRGENLAPFLVAEWTQLAAVWSLRPQSRLLRLPIRYEMDAMNVGATHVATGS